ncbi:hypothetical protein TcCL_NonESM12156, partial [Trypanosoma cruzi]
GKYAVANRPSCRLGQPQTVTVHVLNDRTLPKWMRRSLPWFFGESAARGVCGEAVAEEPGPSRVSAFVLPARLAYWHAWRFRWRPAREVPAKKTMKPLRHPQLRNSQTIGTPGRTRRACALTLRTNGRTLQPIGQENVNPPLAGRQEVAEFSSGRGSGGGRGGPVSSVKKGTAPPTQGVPCDPQGARACRRVGRSRIAPVRSAATRGTIFGSTPGREFRHTVKRLSCGVCPSFPPGIYFSTAA